MNDIQLRTHCIEMASQLTGKDEVMDLAEKMFRWITQGAWGSSKPAKPQFNDYVEAGETEHHPV